MIANVPTGVWLVPLVAVLVGWYSTFDYARQTLAGTLRPSLTSWGVWTATAALGTGTAWAAGSTVGAIVSGATFLRCAQALAATAYAAVREWRQNRDRQRRGLPPLVAAVEHTRAQRVLDVACLVACGGIGVAWRVTDDPLLGLVLAIGVDAVAAVPTIYHGWKGLEEPKPYLLGMIGPVVALLCLPQRVLADYAWPLWELAVNILLVSGPLLVGWPGGRFRRPVRLGATAGIAALFCAAVLLVFTVVPTPGGRWAGWWAGMPVWSTAGTVAAAVVCAAAVGPGSWAAAHGAFYVSPVTWVVWAALGVVAFDSQLEFGGAGPILLTAVLGASAVSMAVVAVGTAVRRRALLGGGPAPGRDGVWWQVYVDAICTGGAAAAFGFMWFSTATAAILLTIVTDAIAAIPTVVVAARTPHTQPAGMYYGVAVSAGLAALAALVAPGPRPGLIDVAYPLYVLLLTGALAAVIVARREQVDLPAPVPPVPDQDPPYQDPPTVPAMPAAAPPPRIDPDLAFRTLLALDQGHHPPR